MQVCPQVGRSVRLRELLPEAECRGADDLWVERCTCDSRQVQPGDLFVALPGSQCHGQDFLAEAVERGCAAVLTDRPLAGVALPQCVVSDAPNAFGRLCQALAGEPSQQLRVVGITGTNGKTTTSCLIAGVLSAAGRRVGLLGTLGYLDGKKVDAAPLTTPPADQLAAYLARMVENDCSHAVMEVSSHALEQSRTAGVRFDAACITNVRRDHLDYHGSRKRYIASKAKLLGQLAPEGFAVVNADDPTAAGLVKYFDGPVLTVGVERPAEIGAVLVEQHLSEQTFLLSAGSETVAVRTRMIGTHHLSNCLVAAAVGLTYGIDLTTIARGLESVEHVPGRLERIECGQPFGVFVDYAHTPDALAAVLDTLRPRVEGRLICVFGAGGDRDHEKRPLMAQAVEPRADLVVLTTDNPRSEAPGDIIDDVLAGFQQPKDAQIEADRAQAIRKALATAASGDCVLIAGKGHEKFQIIHDEAVPFDDAEVARNWLYDVRPYAEVSN